jgi:Crp-like helix-turn-helix domain
LLALSAAQPPGVRAEHGGHHRQAGAYSQRQQALIRRPAIQANDAATCSGTATSPGSPSGWARRRSFWQVLLTGGPFLRRMTWRLPDTCLSAGNGWGTATLKFCEGPGHPPERASRPETSPCRLAEEAVDGRVQVPQRTLAATLGVARPSLNKVLKDLERDGLIRISYSAIEVLDRAKLAARA